VTGLERQIVIVCVVWGRLYIPGQVVGIGRDLWSALSGGHHYWFFNICLKFTGKKRD
jgi:hypothetical protein